MKGEGLLTDLYELTMVGAYRAVGMRGRAVFELFVRRLPRARGFLVAAGLEQALEFLEDFEIGEPELEALERSGRVSRELLGSLRHLRFTGDVEAVPEGTVIFENEPLLRVVAPLPEAQVVESRLMNLVHFQTVIASTAARSVLAAPGRLLVDFGLRRAHGFEAGLLSARAAYLAGFDGTSTVLAGVRFGIPLYGTMAHSFVEAHDSELEAFRHYARIDPENAVFLIDTYDTEVAARKGSCSRARGSGRGVFASTAAISPSTPAACARSSTKGAFVIARSSRAEGSTNTRCVIS